jgi:hypothetical protein
MRDALQPLEAVPLAQTRPQPPWTYMRHALMHPANLLFVVAGATLACALKSLSVLVVGMVIEAVIAVAATRFCSFRAAIDQRVALRERLIRAERRENRLLEADSVHRDQFADLSGVVDDIERSGDGGELAERLELQDLLERYIELAVAHRRCVAAMRRADRDRMAKELSTRHLAAQDGEIDRLRRRRLAIVARRAEHWDECFERARALREELGAVAEFIRFVGQKVACPDLLRETEIELESRLGDLEATEAAFRQLDAA